MNRAFESSRPAPRLEPKWFTTFACQLAQTQALANYGGQLDLLMIGDSITEATSWIPTFGKHFAGQKLLNLGIGGDKTQNVLWRIENGLLNGLKPRAVTLLIGVNNFWPDVPADEIAAGAIACGQLIRQKLPDAKFVHFGVLPLGAHVFHLNTKVDAINAQIATAVRGYSATYATLRDEFIVDGKEKPGMLAADGVHLNGPAYDRWGARLAELLKGRGSQRARSSRRRTRRAAR